MPGRDATVTVKGGVQMTVTAEVIAGFSDEVYDAIFAEGVKVFLAKGMTKISKDDKEGIEVKANENLENLKAGKLKASRARKPAGIPHAVAVEARRLALNALKQEAKRQGVKWAHVATKDRNALVAEILEGPDKDEFFAQAKDNLDKAGRPGLFEGKGIVIHADDRKAAQVTARAEKAKASKAEKAEKAGAALRPGMIPQKGGGLRPQAR